MITGPAAIVPCVIHLLFDTIQSVLKRQFQDYALFLLAKISASLSVVFDATRKASAGAYHFYEIHDV